MRIVCPDCQTHYEVANNLIGSNSRRLRCGQCGHGWRFVMDHLPDHPAEVAPVIPVQPLSEDKGQFPVPEVDEALGRRFGQPSDDEAKVEMQAALRDEALSHPHQETIALPPEPVATTEADRFADIVRAARNNKMELEPERARQHHSPKAGSRLLLPLLVLLVLGLILLVERHAVMHALHLS